MIKMDDQPPTPTKSEFATFQVLANQEFINLNKKHEEDEYSVRITVVEDKTPMPAWEEEVPEEELDSPPSSPRPEPKVEPEPEPRFDPPRPPFVPFVPSYQYSPADIAVESVDSPAPSKSPASYASKKSEDEEEPSPPRRPTKQRESTAAEIEAEKEGLLSEIYAMERQGDVKLVKQLTMNDSLEEIQFQYDRMHAEINANQMVEFAKSAIKMGSGMIEMVLKKSGIKVVDGYHTNLCKDMSKFNRPLNRLYKKYWRRGGMSPEAELGMLVFGSLAWTVVQNKMGSFGQEKEEAPAPKPSKPPPQMSSLNIPTSWGESDEEKPDPKLAETRAREQKMEQREREAEQREREAQEKERALLIREQRLAAAAAAYKEELETVGSLDEENVRKVSIGGTPTKRRSRKKAEVELNLDDD